MGVRWMMMEEQSDARAEAARKCIWEVAARGCFLMLVREGFV